MAACRHVEAARPRPRPLPVDRQRNRAADHRHPDPTGQRRDSFVPVHCVVLHQVRRDGCALRCAAQQPPPYPRPTCPAWLTRNLNGLAPTGGARAVPIYYNQTEAELLSVFSQVNGVLFAGGSASLHNTSDYYAAGVTVYKAAVAANLKGDFFPLWGTCLGFEELGKLMSGSSDAVLSAGFDSENYPVALKPAGSVAALAKSRCRLFTAPPTRGRLSVAVAPALRSCVCAGGGESAEGECGAPGCSRRPPRRC